MNRRQRKRKDEELTTLEIARELRAQARVYQDSYREVDGQIREPRALLAIAALRQAAKIVRPRKIVRGK